MRFLPIDKDGNLIQRNSETAKWQCGWRRGSAASLADIAGSVHPGSVDVVCLARGLCDRLIARAEDSYRVWCVWMWSRSPGRAGRNPELCRSATGEKKIYRNNRGKGQRSRFTGFDSPLDIRYPEWRFCVVFLRRSYSSSLPSTVMSVLVHGADIFKSCVELVVHLQKLK